MGKIFDRNMVIANDAQKVYSTLCTQLDNMKWKNSRYDLTRTISTTAVGKDLTVNLRFYVSEQRKLFYVKSPLPFIVPEATRDVVGKALHIANFSMLNGCFEYNVDTGYVGFKILMPIEGCEVSLAACKYMILLTCQMVDKFNDKLLAVAKELMTLQQFNDFVQKA